MCGRITQKSPPGELRLTIMMGTPDDPRVTKAKARYNGAPSQELLVIRKHPKTGVYQQNLLRWGLIPNWIKEAHPKTKPINATAERVATAPMFRQAYAKRRCIVPVDNFFEWKAIKGGPKQPYAIALQSGQPFGIAGKAGSILKQVRSSAPSASSPARPTNWLAASMTACRSFCRPKPMSAGWPISSLIRASCSRRSQPSK